jgi:hypothetical protein
MHHIHSIAAIAVLLAAPMQAQVVDAGPDTLLCNGPYAMQGSAVPVGGIGTWTLLMGCAMIIDPASPTTEISSLCPGENVFVWAVFDGMTTTTDTVTIGVSDLPTIANAGPDQTVIGPPFSAQLMGNPPVFPSYCVWTIVAGTSSITDPTDPNAMVSGLNVGSNTFMWTCFTGPCVTSDEMTVNAFMWTGVGSASQQPDASLIVDPQSKMFSLITDKSLSGAMLTDNQGRTLELYPVGSDRTWSTGSFGAGVYLLRIKVDGEWRVFRFVVSR